MGYIRETNLKKGGVRYQAEVRLKGMPKALTAVFDRKNDAKAWISKAEIVIKLFSFYLFPGMLCDIYELKSIGSLGHKTKLVTWQLKRLR